jgi:CBS domain-containing protein
MDKSIQELMVRHVATVSPDEGLDRAVKLMSERSCGCLPVVDEEHHPLAMVTDRDVCLAAWREDLPLSEMAVKNAMSVSVISCRPEDSVAAAEHLMGLHQVRRLPVVDSDGRLVGLVSLEDLAREARKEEGWIAPPVTTEAVGRTLGEIGRPRILRGI